MTPVFAAIGDASVIAALGALVGVALSGVIALLLQNSRDLRQRDEEMRELLDSSDVKGDVLQALERDEASITVQRERSRRLVVLVGSYTGFIVLTGLSVGLLTSSGAVVAAAGGVLIVLVIMLVLFQAGRSRRIVVEESERLGGLDLLVLPTEERVPELAVAKWLKEEGWKVDLHARAADLVGTRDDDEKILVEVRTRRPRQAELNQVLGQATRARLVGGERKTRFALVLAEGAIGLSEEDLHDLTALGIELFELRGDGKVRPVLGL